MKFSTATIVLCVSLSAAFCCVAKAQDHFPSKPIRIIVPTGAGGPNDLVLRILSDKYSSHTGQAFVIENRTGGSGSLAAQEVARATPDGYVLLAGTPTTLSINPHTIKPARYDPESDFAPITQLVTTNFFFLARADLPAKNLDELIALAKRDPGKISFGSSGPGSITHLIMAMFGASASIDFLHVPYRSTTLAINDLIAGHIDTAVGPIDAVTEFVKAGKIKVLAVASAKRAATMPEVPTFGEERHPDVVASLWMGCWHLPARRNPSSGVSIPPWPRRCKRRM